MNFEPITEYLTVHEIRGRWKLDPDSLMLHRAVMKGVLKVRMWLDGAFPNAMLDQHGNLAPMLLDGVPTASEVNAWCLPTGGVQVDAFEFTYSYAMQDTADGPRYWALRQAKTLTELLTSCVVTFDDLIEAETRLKGEEAEKWRVNAAATRERNSMLRIISAMAVDGYSYDPSRKEHAKTIELLQRATAAGGEKPMSAQTIAKYLESAYSTFPPPRGGIGES